MVGSVAAGPVAPARADWVSAASGPADIVAASLPATLAPGAVAADLAVTVSWTPVTFAGASLSYVVRRYDGAGKARVVGAGCAGRIPAPEPPPETLSCTEDSVPAGTWTYTVTPVLASWLGGESG